MSEGEGNHGRYDRGCVSLSQAASIVALERAEERLVMAELEVEAARREVERARARAEERARRE